MITSKQQGSLLPLTSDQQTRVLRHVMKILSARCNVCMKPTIAVWDVRSDGMAGRYHCVECGEYGMWHHLMDERDYKRINWRYLK